jgi:hypothetical protein
MALGLSTKTQDEAFDIDGEPLFPHSYQPMDEPMTVVEEEASEEDEMDEVEAEANIGNDAMVAQLIRKGKGPEGTRPRRTDAFA